MEWHWVASDRTGRLLVALDNPGQIHLSRDAGQTWDVGNSPVQNWISAAVYHTFPAGDTSGMLNPNVLAAAFGGGLYETNASGWAPVGSGVPGVDFSNREWESVAATDNGTALAAVLNGPIYLRTTPIRPWVQMVLRGTTQTLVSGWRAVALSQAGVGVAASQDGDVFVSTDLVNGWERRDVVVDGTPVFDPWYRIAISRDGNVIAVAGRFNSGLYISRDQGMTWTRANTPAGDYTAVSVDGDGSVIAATLTNASGAGAPQGSVQLSQDGGRTFTAQTMPGTDTNWRAIALSDDGNSIIVAAGTFTKTTGQLYTSVGGGTP